MRLVFARAVTVLITGLATLVATALTPPLASAKDPVPIPLPVVNIAEPVYLTPIYLEGGELEGVTVDLPAAGDAGVQVDTQCIDIPGVGRSCIGTPTAAPQVPLDVNGGEQLAPLVKWSSDARAALNWMIPEGIEQIATLYELPRDYRILTYARPALRTYLVMRLQQIMDKKAYGVALTAEEQKALAWVEQEYLDRDRLLAQAAWEEYTRFKLSPCTYRAPKAPAYIDKPEVLPKKVIDWCKLPTTQTSVAFEFVPPLPSPKQFTAWAAYRNADQVGLAAMENPVTLGNLSKMSAAAAGAAGFAAATGGVLTIAGGTAIANLSAIGAKVFPHAVRAVFKAAVDGGTQLGVSAGFAGALAVAIIAIVAIVFLVVTSVSIWLLIEHDSVAETLRARVTETQKETDPFGLADLNKKLGGKPLNSELDLDNPPGYRSLASYQTLSARMAEWTSTYAEEPSFLPRGTVGRNAATVGTSIADPSGVWADNATTATDPSWIVRVDDKAPVERKQISVPHKDGYATVRFSRGWMVVTRPGGSPEAALDVSYIDVFGDRRLVTVDPATQGLIESYVDPRGEARAERTTTLRYRNSNGELVRARLKGDAPTYLDGPRPVAVGPLTTGRPVLLRPNPVGTNGASLDEAVVQNDYEFDWTVERLDLGTGVWSEVAVPDGYGSKFVPTQVGQYDARVTMTSLDDPTSKKYGSVRFTVTPPAVQSPVVALIDNGSDRLELDLQLLEEVPSDELTLEVTWPGDLGSDTDPTQTLVLECIQTGPIECTTPRTGLLDSLVFPVTPQTDLRRPVRVVATNSTGGGFQAEFLLGEGRPTFAAPPAEANASEPGTTLVTENGVQVSMPLPEITENQDYLAAALVPSPGGGQDFGLVDPVTGNTTGQVLIPSLNQGVIGVDQDPVAGTWYLTVRGVPDLSDVGSLEVPVVVAQTNGTRQLLLVTIHVAPSTEDRYRGALQSDVDPQDFAVDTLPQMYPMVLGGRVGDAAYTGTMCVSLRLSGPDPARVRCRPVADFYDAQGVVRPFPYAELYPSGMPSGNYAAKAWLSTPGARVDNTPLPTSFFLTQAASYPRPVVAVGKVTVRGKAVVGRRLRSAVASLDPSTATVRYQWLRNGRPVKGATGRSYLLRRADRGDRISVRVRATFPEWTAGTRSSAQTRRVR